MARHSHPRAPDPIPVLAEAPAAPGEPATGGPSPPPPEAQAPVLPTAGVTPGGTVPDATAEIPVAPPPAPANPTPESRLFEVRCGSNLPRVRLWARDEVDALSAWRDQLQIRRTDLVPTITAVPEDLRHRPELLA